MNRKEEEPLDVWREKLKHLRLEEALCSDPEQKFTIQKAIEEAKSKIAELESIERAESLDPESPEGRLAAARKRLKELTLAGAPDEEIKQAKEAVLNERREVRQGNRLRAGDVLLDRYEVIECVGVGGFATVWKCYDEERQRLVAVKVLHPSHHDDGRKKERFFRGSRLMKELSHKHIVEVIEPKYLDDSFHFYVMELVEGVDFRKSVLAGELSQDEVLEVICQAGEALAYAHDTIPDLIHRDVKPSNILLTCDKQAKVTDFDLVRAAETTGGTRTGSLGTFIYAAPETMENAAGHQVGVQADVFSLGMTAVFGLLGRELGTRAFRDPAKIVDSLPCSDAVKSVLKKAVEWEIEDRYSTMLEFVEALREAIKSREPRTVHTPPSIDTIKIDDFRFVEIPPGRFTMGEEDSSREVEITQPFLLAATQVTQTQWQSVMGTDVQEQQRQKNSYGGLVGIGPELPMYHVDWLEAVAFCDRLTELLKDRLPDGFRFTLPTEAEWEYACRAGTDTRFCFGDEAAGLGDFGWYNRNSGGEVHAVGSKKPNTWGLHDMHGNVWEWCWDWYDGAPSDTVDPVGPRTGSLRVLRGGSWNFNSGDCRSALRGRSHPEFRYSSLGFRVAAVRDQAWHARQATRGEGRAEREKIAVGPTSARVTEPKELAPDDSNTIGAPESLDLSGIRLTRIPAGAFRMGSPANETGRDNDGNQRDVRITQPFYLGVTQVTQAQWQDVMGSDIRQQAKKDSAFGRLVGVGRNLPMYCVNWDEAVEFCEKLNERDRFGLPEGFVFTLPTEAEWEYACRAGTVTRYHFGDDDSHLDDYAWYSDNSVGEVRPVGTKKPNAWGLHDMHGNVWEWCWDWFLNSPLETVEPAGSRTGSLRVFRGGSWGNDSRSCRSADRFRSHPEYRDYNLGFRVAAVREQAWQARQATRGEGRAER